VGSADTLVSTLGSVARSGLESIAPTVVLAAVAHSGAGELQIIPSPSDHAKRDPTRALAVNHNNRNRLTV
jgi:hypothetical protein